MKALLLTPGKLDLNRYRKIMSDPMWGLFFEVVHATRAYEKGLELARRLLSFQEHNLDKLSQGERDHNLKRLYRFILRMQDRLDRWEEYIVTWETIRANTSLTDTYSKGIREFAGSTLESFVLSEDGGRLHVHFLWSNLERKQTIERKLERKRSGRKTGNLFHRQGSELTEAEIQRRLDFVVVKIRYVEKTRGLIDLARRHRS